MAKLISMIIVTTLFLGISIGATMYDVLRNGSQTYTSIGDSEIQLNGVIRIDGSSTVYPITEYISTLFMEEYPSVSVYVGVSGTGGGFKRFITGEIDINDASRPIKEVEKESALENGIRYVEIPIAIDGVVVVVNPGNTWVDYLTLDELRMIWAPDSEVRLWSDIRPEWPDKPINLYGPGPDSGTFDFFTEYLFGEAGVSRVDYVASEDDNVIVRGVSQDLYGLGFFGLAYYLENMDVVKAVAIDAGEGPIEPSLENVQSFKYPMSRLLYIYVNADKLVEDPVLRLFVKFYLENAPEAVSKVGYAPLPAPYYRAAAAMVDEAVLYGYVELALHWAPRIVVTYDPIQRDL